MGTSVMKHPVPDRVKPSFVIFEIRALCRSKPYGNTVVVKGLIQVVGRNCITYKIDRWYLTDGSGYSVRTVIQLIIDPPE